MSFGPVATLSFGNKSMNKNHQVVGDWATQQQKIFAKLWFICETTQNIQTIIRLKMVPHSPQISGSKILKKCYSNLLIWKTHGTNLSIQKKKLVSFFQPTPLKRLTWNPKKYPIEKETHLHKTSLKNVNSHQECTLLRIPKKLYVYHGFFSLQFRPRYSSSTHQGMESCYGLWQSHRTYCLSKVRWGLDDWMIGVGVVGWNFVGVGYWNWDDFVGEFCGCFVC